MTSRVSIKNKEKKRPKGKIVLKIETKQQKRYKETENSIVRSRTRLICTFKQPLDLCTTVIHMI